MTAHEAKEQITKPLPLASIVALLTLVLTLLGVWAVPKAMGREEGSNAQRLTAVEERAKKNETSIESLRGEMRDGFNRVIDKLDERTIYRPIGSPFVTQPGSGGTP